MRVVWAIIVGALLSISGACPSTSREVRVSQACLDAPLAPGCMP